jgi:hypothetical protein
VAEGRQHYNITLAILTLGRIAYALQQTMVIPALRRERLVVATEVAE